MPNSTDKNSDKDNLMNNKKIKQNMRQVDKSIGQLNMSLYGTDRNEEIDSLNDTFQSLLQSEINSINQKDSGDITSFINKLWSSDKKTTAMDEMMSNQFLSLAGDDFSAMQGFIDEAYKNRLLEQSDLHEVASQLIELSEAILITRDAIISADIVEGRMSRTIEFDNTDDEKNKNNISMVENMENKFGLLEKIKNFIVPKTLEYGEYYAYIIPYSVIFNDFVKQRDREGYGGRIYREGEEPKTLLESVSTDTKKSHKKEGVVTESEIVNKIFDIFKSDEEAVKTESAKFGSNEEFEKSAKDDIRNILSNITISDTPVPLPILEEGFDSIKEYMTEYVNENGDNAYIESKTRYEKSYHKNTFEKVISNTNDGITLTNDSSNKRKRKDMFDDVTDCYIKLIEPTRIIPIKIMNQTIGYYYVVAEDISPLSGMISSTLYYAKFDEARKEKNIVDTIADQVIRCFDKKFLKENSKFKNLIAEAINYYNLNERRIKFQFIPVEYIQEFKIDEDEDGNGQSMIKKSLFYAKLYLMLLLFKIMSIILYSNDTKVNYIKTSGIDKNLANKVQEIARIKQSRQINMMDLFNYTTLINKVGNGNEMYIPTGRSGERPIETEILSGQDIQLNSELLEMLKNAYILATGVPAAIVNYLNEADFAKVIEQNNSKFNARVVNYQLDFNKGITEMYKKIMKWSTNIDPSIIDNFSFILQAPKTVASNTKAEAINTFTQLADFLVSILYPDPNNSVDTTLPDKIRIFKKMLIEDQLPLINMERVEKIFQDAEAEATKKSLQPNPDNGDSGLDGLENELENL